MITILLLLFARIIFSIKYVLDKIDDNEELERENKKLQEKVEGLKVYYRRELRNINLRRYNTRIK